MFVIITGGSGSGKSEYAENLVVSLGEKRMYLATMIPFGEEGKRRIRRHRQMRAGRGFQTVECQEKLYEMAVSLSPFDGTVLLECMSNLVANEIFSPDGQVREGEPVAERILDGVRKLRERCRHLVIVTNEVFSDGISYGTDMESYIRTLALINMRLAEQADQVTEVVCGIPVMYPGKQEDIRKEAGKL